ncbi:hypothetical protein [Haladaptatus sp. DFWS20]|uniref:hypothetical protein n=1 Tax=Haladaptatus sp. DFWS20 TaxID=3403467 RepID=UPI003EBF45D6
MSNTSTRSALLPERPLLVGAVLLTALVTAWVFIPTMQGHVAIMNSGSVDVTATEYTVADDGEHLAIALQIHNPTGRKIAFSSGQIHAYDGEVQLSDGTTTSLDGATVPAGETVEVNIEMDLDSKRVSQTKQAVQSGSITVSGRLKGEIGDQEVRIPVEIEGSQQ